METKEPKIFSDGLTKEEIHRWMRGKVNSYQMLCAALEERDLLLQALRGAEDRISELTNAAELELLDKHRDPIRLP